MAFLQIALYSNAAYGLSLEGTPFIDVGKKYNLDPVLLYAVSLIESSSAGGKGVGPHPYAIRSPSTAYYPESFTEASTLLPTLIEEHPSVDIGIMQINWRWHYDKVSHPNELLDPTTNIFVGARILRDSINSKPGNLVMGIGTYHSPTPIRAENYGQRVLAVYNNLKKLTR